MTDSIETPLVTIGIPTYNRAAGGNLQRVIERALQQTYTNIEVIVSDNCSSDNTSDVVNSFDDSRLQYFPQSTNIGAVNNFNFCLDKAKGKFFLLFHDDDSVDPDFIETCLSSLEPGKDVGVVYTGIRVIDQNDKILEEHENNAGGLSALDFVLGWFHGEVALFIPNSLYNTEYLKELGGFHSKHNLYVDLVPTFALQKKYGRVDIKDIKASFRRHTSNMSYSTPMKLWIEDGVFLLDVLKKLFPDNAAEISDIGGKYLCRKMYWKSWRRAGIVRRWLDYFRAYKAYNYCYSPFNYAYQKNIHGRIVRLKRRVGLA